MKCEFLTTESNGVLSKSKSRRCVTYVLKTPKLFLSVSQTLSRQSTRLFLKATKPSRRDRSKVIYPKYSKQ